MQKWGLWILLAIGAVVLARGRLALACLIFVVAVLVFYLISLQLHPRRVCRRCNGTGRHWGAMFWWADRACTRCGGPPRHRRLGVQVLHGAAGKQTWAERKAKEAAKRRAATR